MANIIQNFFSQFGNRTQQKNSFYLGAGNKREPIPNLEVASFDPLSNIAIKSILQTPAFHTFYKFYSYFDEVSTPVNLLAQRVVSLSGSIEDTNGYERKDIWERICDKMDVNVFIFEFVVNRCIHGQVPVASLKGTGKQYIQVVPSHQVYLWEGGSFNISRMNWLFESSTLEITDDFVVPRIANIDSKYFGRSPFSSFYDKLNQLHLDTVNVNQFFENNSFFGAMIVLKDGINISVMSDEEKLALQQIKENINDPKARYQATILSGVERVEQIRQEIGSKLTDENKLKIAAEAAKAIGYPPILLERTSAGLGQGEQKTARQNLKEQAVDPIQSDLARAFNQFIIPQLFEDEDLGSIREGLIERKATPRDFKFVPKQMQVESDTEMMEIGVRGFEAGLLLGSEAKTRFWNYKQSDLNDDDAFRKLSSGVVIIKEGQMKEGQVGAADASKDVQDEKLEEIADKKTESSEDTSQKSDFKIPKLGSKDKRQIKRIITNLKSDNASRVEKLIETDKFKELQKLIQDAIKNQYQSLNIRKLLKQEFLKMNQKAEDSLRSNLEKYIEQNINTFSSGLSVETLSALLLMLGNVGKDQAIQDALDAGAENLNEAQRLAINTEIHNFITTRIKSLIGLENVAGLETALLNPILPQGLDKTTYAEIAALIAVIIAANPTASLSELESLIEQTIQSRVADRARLIAESEVGRIFNVGFVITAGYFPQLFWQWQRTKSIDPREIHLVLVGQVRPVGTTFDGEMPGVRPNCKCSLKLVKSNKV